jgi:O-antigen/teichoic acid export membrane protein
VSASIARRISQLGGETVVYGIAGTIGRFISIFLIPLYTRAFSPTDYGQIAILTAFTTLLNTFIVLGLDSASGRWYYDSNDAARRRRVIASWFWTQSAVGWMVAALGIALAAPIATVLLKSSGPASAQLVALAVLTVPLSTFGKVIGNWLRYQRRPWLATGYFTASSLLTIGAVVLFVLVWKQGVAGLFLGQIVSAALTGVAAVAIMWKWLAPRGFSKHLTREMVAFGLPLVPAAVAAWVTASADRFILRGFVPTAEIGIYSIGASLAAGIALLTSAFQLAWGPFAYSIIDDPQSNRVYGKVLSIYSLVTCAIGTALSLFAPLLLRLLTTPDYYEAASTVPWLVFAYVAMGATYIVALGSTIVKKSGFVAASIFIGAAVNTALNFILIPRIGRDGAAIATFAAYLTATVYLYFASQRVYRIPYRPVDAIACLGLSWLLIAVDYVALPPAGLWATAVRVAMCLLFVPLAFALRIVLPAHVRQARAYLGRRLRHPGEPPREGHGSSLGKAA